MIKRNSTTELAKKGEEFTSPFNNLQKQENCINMVNAQEWLESQEEYNTKEKRQKVKELNISNQNLEGKLDLSDFVNLERLNCSDNLLTDINLTSLNPEKIKTINLTNNNLSERDLTCFSEFTNLELMSLDTDEKKRKEGKYNRFYGSLKPLESLNKLTRITINNTNIDSGLECLPEVTGGIFTDCGSLSSSSFNDLGCRRIYEQLKEHFEAYWVESSTYLPFLEALDESNGYYVTKINLEAWRIENMLTYRRKAKEKLSEENLSLQSQLTDLKEKFARTDKGSWKKRLDSFRDQLDESETVFEQQIKSLKSDWNSQIKKKKNEITNILHSGKGNSAQLKKEIEGLKSKLSDHKKLTEQLRKARNMLDCVDLGDEEELDKVQSYLTNSLQEIQKVDNNQYQKGAHQIVKEIRERYEGTQKTYENIEKNRENNLEKLISSTKKLTQKLLGNQQLETRIESLYL